MTIALVVLSPRLRDEQGPLDAKEAAVEHLGGCVAHDARREDDLWEVDFVRPDGSIVQVNLGEDLELQGLDEELGPAGTLADDELSGELRARSVRAAFAKTGIGKVVSLERDANGGIEARVRPGCGCQIELELDRKFRVIEIDDESLGDE